MVQRFCGRFNIITMDHADAWSHRTMDQLDIRTHQNQSEKSRPIQLKTPSWRPLQRRILSPSGQPRTFVGMLSEIQELNSLSVTLYAISSLQSIFPFPIAFCTPEMFLSCTSPVSFFQVGEKPPTSYTSHQRVSSGHKNQSLLHFCPATAF